MYYSELNEGMLTDIILCDPITSKGKRALARLGLESAIVPRSFFCDFYADSRFEKEFEREVPDEFEMDEREYIFRRDKYDRIKDNIDDFEKRISSEVPNQSPLVVMGVAGNGKSVEVYRLVHAASIDSDTASNILVVDFDDESPDFRLTYHVQYYNPFPQSVQWGICFKLLKTVMDYIQSKKDRCARLSKNY